MFHFEEDTEFVALKEMSRNFYCFFFFFLIGKQRQFSIY